jgi:hypothetical protein
VRLELRDDEEEERVEEEEEKNKKKTKKRLKDVLHKLDGPGNCFERKNTDEFQIEAVDLGELKKIRIGHDNSGVGPGWFLEKVQHSCY